MVQLGVRVSQFYEHESCGKCTPCRVGTRWLTQILKKIESGRGDARRPRPAARRRRADQRHVPLPARRLGRDRGGELRREVPRRVPRARRGGRLPVPRRLVARRHRRADGRPRGARRPAEIDRPLEVRRDERHRHSSRSTTARSRSRRAPASSRRRRPRGSRSRSSATSRGSGRRSARAACASSRSRGSRSSRQAAR